MELRTYTEWGPHSLFLFFSIFSPFFLLFFSLFFLIFFKWSWARIQSGDHTEGYEMRGCVCVRLLHCGGNTDYGWDKYASLRGKILLAGRQRNMRCPIPPIYSLCTTTTSFLPRGHKGHASTHHQHFCNQTLWSTFMQMRERLHCNICPGKWYVCGTQANDSR